MMRASNIRLPGVYFLPPPRARGLGLPPLDVAAFVGFAERGPLDWPVMVEDLDSYRRIFGGDLPLAREPGGRTVYAHLPSAVATFFANGGTRCYVVRVAGREATQTLFRLRGMVALKGGQDPATASQEDGPRLVTVKASSEGRWSERLRIGARLRMTPLPAAAFEVRAAATAQTAAGPRFFQRLTWETGSAPQAIQPGELLRLTFNDGQQFLFPVTQVRRRANATPATPVELLAQHTWQLTLPSASQPARLVVRIDRLSAQTTERINASGRLIVEGGKFSLRMTSGGPLSVERDDVLQVKQIDNRSFLFPVSETGTWQDSAGATQPVAHANRMLLLPAQDIPQASPPSLVSVERLRFDLLLREGKDHRPTIDELSFNDGHPRFWGDAVLLESSSLRRQQTDGAAAQEEAQAASAAQSSQLSPAALSATIFRAMRGDTRIDETQLALLDRAALAGLLAPAEVAERTCLPLDMLTILTEDQFTGPAGDDIGTDDLEAFVPELFVDPVLVPNLAAQTTSGDALMREAFDRFYVQDKRLRGLHSLMFVGEAALVSVSDAAQREWERVKTPPPPPLPVTPPSPPDLSKFIECPPPLLSPPVEMPPPGVSIAPPPPQTSAPDLPLLKAINTDDETDPQYERELRNLVEIQHALLNFCEARRDVVGVFTLPHYFEKRQCIKWQEELRVHTGLPRRRSLLAEAREIADLSYVSVYHPWLLLADANSADGLRALPADGAVCGMIALREHEAQVWVAPANLPLAGVLGLAPVITTEDWADLFDLRFNLIRAEPSDFRAMSAHTLSDESIWLQISVRRLLILLRKLVVERGMDFVFESNDDRLREGMRLMLEEVLKFMYEGGAFAGASPAQSYQIVTDESVNPRQSVDAGRFIAQIQVAPAQPLEFITVLLTRVAEDLLQAREA